MWFLHDRETKWSTTAWSLSSCFSLRSLGASTDCGSLVLLECLQRPVGAGLCVREEGVTRPPLIVSLLFRCGVWGPVEPLQGSSLNFIYIGDANHADTLPEQRPLVPPRAEGQYAPVLTAPGWLKMILRGLLFWIQKNWRCPAWQETRIWMKHNCTFSKHNQDCAWEIWTPGGGI